MNDETNALDVTPTTDIAEIERQQHLAKLEAELEEESKHIATAVTSMPIISTKGGVFTFPDSHVVNGPLDLVILGARLSKQLWNKKYDEGGRDEMRGLICAAVSSPEMERELVPFDSAVQRQSNTCESCPQNQWINDPQTGKRRKSGDCKDSPIFVVMAPDLKDKSMYFLRGSATGVTEATALMQKLKIMFTHPLRAICTFSFKPTPRGAARLTYTEKGANPLWDQHYDYRNRAKEMLEAPPRWYKPDAIAAPVEPSAPPKEHAAPASSGRKARSAASAS